MDLNELTQIIKKFTEKDYIDLKLLNKLIDYYNFIDYYEKNELEKLIIADFDESHIDILIGLRDKCEPIKNRIINTLKDKLKQINIYLDVEFIDNAVLFLSGIMKNIDRVEDIRIVGGETAIVTDNDVIIDYNFYEINDESRISKSSYELFSASYNYVVRHTNEILKCLNVNQRLKIEANEITCRNEITYKNDNKVKIYFDACMSELCSIPGYMNFKMIVVLENKDINLYKIEINNNKWTAFLLEGNELVNSKENLNKSLLKIDEEIHKYKDQTRIRIFTDNNPSRLDKHINIEISLDCLRNNLNENEYINKSLSTYWELNNNNFKKAEQDFHIERIKYILAEKITQLGADYYEALEYAETIIKGIEEYNKQVYDAVRGVSNYPDVSLEGALLKLERPINKI